MVIKPDTSLYGKMPERLCALAAGLGRGEGELLEERDPRTGAWELANGTAAVLVIRLAQGWDFRIKPKPRELWMVEFEDGSFGHHWESEKEARAGMPASTKVARFVESPPAA